MSYVGIGNRQDYIADFPTQSFNGDGSTTTFTLNFEAVTASIRVAVDNVLQPADGSSYYVDGNSLTFSSAPASGTSNISVVYLGTVRQISTVSDNSIANSKIQYPLTESGATVSTFNRTTSDGTVLDIQKDGTSAGTLKTVSGVTLALDGSGSFCGFQLGGTGIVPRQNGTLSTGVDLGTSSYPFDNVYVGSNIYLGGTGSANALSDYEEGTGSVYLRVEGRGDGSVTGTFTSSYTKIGNRVFVRFRASITGVTGADSGRAMEIRGLPFTVTSTADSTGSARLGVLSSSVTGYQVILFSNGTDGRIEEWTGTTGTNMSNHFQNTSSVLLELSYETTA